MIFIHYSAQTERERETETETERQRQTYRPTDTHTETQRDTVEVSRNDQTDEDCAYYSFYSQGNTELNL